MLPDLDDLTDAQVHHSDVTHVLGRRRLSLALCLRSGSWLILFLTSGLSALRLLLLRLLSWGCRFSSSGRELSRRHLRDHRVPEGSMWVHTRVNLDGRGSSKGLGILGARHVTITEPLTATRRELLLDLSQLVHGAGSLLLLRLSGGRGRGLGGLNRGVYITSEVLDWVERLLVEVVEGRGFRWGLCCEHLGNLVDSNLTVSLIVPGPHIKSTLGHFDLTSYKDVVPLGDLSVTHLLVDIALGAVKFNLIAQLMQVEVHGLTIVQCLLRDGAQNGLPRR